MQGQAAYQPSLQSGIRPSSKDVSPEVSDRLHNVLAMLVKRRSSRGLIFNGAIRDHMLLNIPSLESSTELPVFAHIFLAVSRPAVQ